MRPLSFSAFGRPLIVQDGMKFPHGSHVIGMACVDQLRSEIVEDALQPLFFVAKRKPFFLGQFRLLHNSLDHRNGFRWTQKSPRMKRVDQQRFLTDLDAHQEMPWTIDSMNRQAQAFSDRFVNQCQRDRQSAMGFEDMWKQAVVDVKIVLLISTKVHIVEENSVHVREDCLGAGTANPLADGFRDLLDPFKRRSGRMVGQKMERDSHRTG
jgi:hypothetical protein